MDRIDGYRKSTQLQQSQSEPLLATEDSSCGLTWFLKSVALEISDGISSGPHLLVQAPQVTVNGT